MRTLQVPATAAIAKALQALVAFWLVGASIGHAAAAGPFEQHGNSRWVVYASRQNLDEAIGLARRLHAGARPDKGHVDNQRLVRRHDRPA